MDYFQRFLKIFGSLIGIILLYFVVRYAVLQFQGDAALLDKVSPATLEEVTQDPSIFDALEEPMGEEAAEDETEETAIDGAAVADEEAEAAAEEEAATDEAAAEEELTEASADEADAEEAVAEGDTAESDADEAAAAAAVDEANTDEAEAASAEAEAEVDETAVKAEEEVAEAGSEEAAVEEDAEETVTESDDELAAADSAEGAEAEGDMAADEEANGDANDASSADEGDAATTPIGGPDSVLAEFHSAVIPDEYADLVSTVEADEESIARGETTYTIFCTSCHGESGMGDGPAGQLLDPPAAPIAQTSHMVSDAYLFWRVSEGGAEFGTAMTPWKGSLDEEARWDVINYIRSIDPEAGQGGHGQQGQGQQRQGQQDQGGQDAGNAAGHDDEPLSAENHYWVLGALNDSRGESIDLVESDEITASFSDGSLSGITACSNYAGRYEDDDNALSITISATSPLADPLEGCGDGGEVDDQEEAYLEALESTASYAAQRGQMELSDEDGNVLLSFDAVPVK